MTRSAFMKPKKDLLDQHRGEFVWGGLVEFQHARKKELIDDWANRNATDHTPGNDWRVVWRVQENVEGQPSPGILRIESAAPGSFTQ